MLGCESWTIKKAEHQRIDAFELLCWRRLLRVLWTARKSSQSILKEIIGRTDSESETPVFWRPDANWLIGKDPDAGKDWRWEKGRTEEEMVGWHHRLNGHEFEQTGQGGRAYCTPWGLQESDTTEWLHWDIFELIFVFIFMFNVSREIGRQVNWLVHWPHFSSTENKHVSNACSVADTIIHFLEILI